MRRKRNTKPFSLRIDPDLLQDVQDIAALEGVSAASMFEDGLRYVVKKRHADDDGRLKRALEAIRAVRAKMKG